AGEIFVEAGGRSRKGAGELVVQTPSREVAGQASNFAVRAGKDGTGVVVTRGKVKFGRLDILAGQQCPPGSDQPTPAPRASHLLGCTRELMSAAESPLAPASQYAGGALIAVDPSGQEAKLSLRKYHVDVHAEDGFARTTIDQTYFNHENQRLE